MDNTWWVTEKQLDAYQLAVIGLAPDGNYLIEGPPGCGKTNLLLMRAGYLSLLGRPNFQIVVLNRTLQEFLVKGASNYQFEAERIKTLIKWYLDFLYENGGDRDVPSGLGFTATRKLLFDRVRNLVDQLKINKVYDTLFLDESQDYTAPEIKLFGALAKNLFLVADSRQQIYSDGGEFNDLVGVLGLCRMELVHHYRTTKDICRVADAIIEMSSNSAGYRPMKAGCNNVGTGTVRAIRCESFSAQISVLIENLRVQIKAYPRELIAVLCPKGEQVAEVAARIAETELAQIVVTQNSTIGFDSFSDENQICVTTLHSAKGLEFRAVNIMACEDIPKFAQQQKRLSYAGITRAKSSVSLYHSGALPAYLDGAIAQSKQSVAVPIKNIFKGNR